MIVASDISYSTLQLFGFPDSPNSSSVLFFCMGINCGSLGVTMVKQSLLTCAGGEAALTTLLVSALVKTQHLLLTQEYMKLLTIRPKMRGDHHVCYPNKAIDAEDGNENEDEDKDGEGEDLSHKDGNPDNKKNDDKKGPDQEESDEEDKDDDQEEDGDDDKDDNEEEEEDVEEESDDEEEEEVGEEDEDEEEALQPPKKRKK